ncbi:IS3 family transposase [Streptomyces mirabilis]|uniref:IS3 family transposase n=1 Tax=Streptomyces mirabilis TaxID=68239 RepID=UPI003691433C
MTEKYEFIDGEAGNFPVQQMCTWAGVSTSGFYHWRSRPSDSQETYGYRRVHAALQRMNVQAGAELVRALMRELGLVPCQPRPWRATTIADDAAPATPDLLARDFTADAPGRKLVSDITYVHTWAGFLYRTTVIDCHTKAVVGWAMADHMKTSLISDALDMAARNIDLAEGCIFHSDRGSQGGQHPVLDGPLASGQQHGAPLGALVGRGFRGQRFGARSEAAGEPGEDHRAHRKAQGAKSDQGIPTPGPRDLARRRVLPAEHQGQGHDGQFPVVELVLALLRGGHRADDVVAGGAAALLDHGAEVVGQVRLDLGRRLPVVRTGDEEPVDLLAHPGPLVAGDAEQVQDRVLGERVRQVLYQVRGRSLLRHLVEQGVREQHDPLPHLVDPLLGERL